MKDKKIMDESISSLYTKDSWTRDFMFEIYDMFGMPKSTESCHSKTDKLLFVWSMMTLVQEMKKNESWRELKNDHDPEGAAYIFVEEYYKKTGKLLLENITEDDVIHTSYNGGDDEI